MTAIQRSHFSRNDVTFNFNAISFATALLLVVHTLAWTRPAIAVVVSDTGFDQLVTPGRPMFGLNLDGVVRVQTQGMSGCNAALITDRHLLTIMSCFDADGDDVVDFPSGTQLQIPFELAGGWETRFATADQIEFPEDWIFTKSDIAILTLSEDAPATVPRYAIYSGNEELGAEVVITGHGYTGRGPTGRVLFLDEKLAGKNRYETTADQLTEPAEMVPGAMTLVYDFDSGVDANNTLQQLGITSDLGFGTLEAMTSLGDGGAPTFLNGVIAGLASFGRGGFLGDVNDRTDQSFGELAYDTRVSSYRDFIELATNGQASFQERAEPVETLPGDLNLDHARDMRDLNLLIDHTAGRVDPFARYDETLDLNSDRQLNADDILIWVEQIQGTWIGDTDLDGYFDSHDLVNILAAGEFEDGITDNSTWATGDWNGNGDFTSRDLVFAFERGGYEQGPRAALQSVPEPSTALLLLFGVTAIQFTIFIHDK